MYVYARVLHGPYFAKLIPPIPAYLKPHPTPFSESSTNNIPHPSGPTINIDILGGFFCTLWQKMAIAKPDPCPTQSIIFYLSFSCIAPAGCIGCIWGWSWLLWGSGCGLLVPVILLALVVMYCLHLFNVQHMSLCCLSEPS